MGRRSHTRTLGLWMNGARLGTWSLAPNAPDTLQYDLDWAQSEQGRPLSLSLPFTPGNAPHRGEKVRAYFENLLPDSKDIRERLARRFKTGSTDAFELLAEIGRDCVGALEILPEGQASAGIAAVQAEPLGEAQVAQVLRSATTPHAMGWGSEDDDFRISIAGAQEKTALLLRDGQWCLPRGGTPTTHIFKLPLGLIGGMKLDMRHSVENEWLCALILKEFGLPVAACQSMQFEDTKALVVERFDRTWWTHPEGGQRLVRLPQEDMCQAMGIAPEAKYEADGGPGIDGILDLCLNVVDGLVVYPKVIEKHMMSELPFMATENIMMDAVKLGGNRQELHERIRELSMEAGRNVKVEGKENNLLELIAADPAFPMGLEELKASMDPSKYIGRSKEQVEAFLKNVIHPILEANKDLLGVKAEINV